MNNKADKVVDIRALKDQAANSKGGMGAVSWAVLEMFTRAGMSEAEVNELRSKMEKFFPAPTDEECNAILKVVEQRLKEDLVAGKDLWY